MKEKRRKGSNKGNWKYYRLTGKWV